MFNKIKRQCLVVIQIVNIGNLIMPRSFTFCVKILSNSYKILLPCWLVFASFMMQYNCHNCQLVAQFCKVFNFYEAYYFGGKFLPELDKLT